MAHTEYSTYDVSPIDGANVRNTPAQQLRSKAKENADNLTFKQELSIYNYTGRDYWLHLPSGEKKHLPSNRTPFLPTFHSEEQPRVIRFVSTTYEDATKYNQLLHATQLGGKSVLEAAKELDTNLYKLLSKLEGGGVALSNYNLITRINGRDFLRVESILEVHEDDLMIPRFIKHYALGLVPGTYRDVDIPEHPFDYESVLHPSTDNVGLCHVKIYDPFYKIKGDVAYMPCLKGVVAIPVERKPYKGTEAVIFNYPNYHNGQTNEINSKEEIFTIDDVLESNSGERNTCTKTQVRIYDTARAAREDETLSADRLVAIKSKEQIYESESMQMKHELLEKEVQLKTTKIDAEGNAHVWKVIAGTVAMTLGVMKLFKL